MARATSTATPHINDNKNVKGARLYATTANLFVQFKRDFFQFSVVLLLIHVEYELNVSVCAVEWYSILFRLKRTSTIHACEINLMSCMRSMMMAMAAATAVTLIGCTSLECTHTHTHTWHCGRCRFQISSPEMRELKSWKKMAWSCKTIRNTDYNRLEIEMTKKRSTHVCTKNKR